MDPFRSASDPSAARSISIKGLRVIWSLGGALTGMDKDMWNGQYLLFNLTSLTMSGTGTKDNANSGTTTSRPTSKAISSRGTFDLGENRSSWPPPRPVDYNTETSTRGGWQPDSLK